MKLKIMFALMFMAMLVLPMASALGETKEIIAPTLTTPYGSVDVYNNWKLPLISSKLATYTLLDNGDSVIDAWASGTVTLYQPGQLYNNLEFKSKLKSLETVKYKIYYYTNEDYTEDVITYKEVCIDDIKNNSKSCNQIEDTRTKITKSREILKEYSGEELKEGTYKWRIEATKPKPNYAIDWIAEAQGVKLDNWAWWNSSFSKKKQLLAQETSGSNLFNYTINFTVTYDSDMKSDFSDIRFVDTTETIEYPYWIESYTASTSAQVYVRIKDINMTANQNTTIYMYYGNAVASTTSNKNNTFLFNDDFGGASLNSALWGSYLGDAGDQVNINGGWLNLLHSTATNHNVGVVAKRTVPYPFKERFNIKYTTSNSATSAMLGACIDSDTADLAYASFDANCAEIQWGIWGSNTETMRDDAGTTSPSPVYAVTLGTTYQMEYDGITATNRTYKINNTQRTSRTANKYRNTPAIYAHGGAATLNFSVSDYRISTYAWREPTYTFGSEQAGNGLTTTLNLPADNYNISTNSVTFNCSATDETGVLNLTLKINGVTNLTVIGGAGQNLSLQITRTMAEGVHNWTCSADDGTAIVTATARNIYIDTITPVINILYPTNNLEIQTLSVPLNNINFNVSITEAGYFTNCWYYNGTTNNSITCRNNATINSSGGYSTLAYYANDSVGNIGSNSTTFLVNYIRPLVNYSATGIEGENYTVYLNLTANNITQANASLTFNGTNYPMDIISYNGTVTAFAKTITLPLVTADTVKGIVLDYYLNNVYRVMDPGIYNMTVYNIPSLSVSSGLCSGTPVYWFTLQDEENLTTINGEFEYNFYYGLSNSSLVRTYGKISSATNFSVCTNTTISPNWIIGSGEIFYSSTGYVDRRYYIFDNTLVTSATNLTLYDLLSTSQTSFKLEIEDTSLNPYDNVYSRLLRWYPDLNTYNIVDMGKTDETGSTVIHVRTEDVDYRIGAYYTNGTLIYLAQPIRMVCLASPCTYTLKISPGDIDYTSFLNIVYTFTYNETTGMWNFVYSDTTGNTDTMNLTVYRVTSTSEYPVCTDSISGAVGALSCNTSAYSTGILRGEVYRSASPPVEIVQKVVHLFTSAFKGSSFGLWLSMLLALPVIFLLSLVSPIGAIIGGVIALIPALYFGSVNIGIVGGIAILGGIVAHFLKRVS